MMAQVSRACSFHQLPSRSLLVKQVFRPFSGLKATLNKLGYRLRLKVALGASQQPVASSIGRFPLRRFRSGKPLSSLQAANYKMPLNPNVSPLLFHQQVTSKRMARH